MAAAMDPFGPGSICSGVSSQTAGQPAPSGQQQAHLDCCSLCGIAQSGSAPLASPEPAIASPIRAPHRIVWLDRSFDLPSRAYGSHAQARAPPSYS
jgi:hypothetical protein